MLSEKHKKRHVELHKKLDELVADFIAHTEKLLSETTLLELMRWSFEQTQYPSTLDTRTRTGV